MVRWATPAHNCVRCARWAGCAWGILPPLGTTAIAVNRSSLQTLLLGALLVALALALGAFTTSQYVQPLSLDYIEHGGQWQRHVAVMTGHGGDPWQYRVLAPYLIEMVMSWCRRFGVEHPVMMSFIGFRVFQDSSVLLLAYAYYRRLGLPVGPALLGLGVLAWSMSYSHYNSDLQFSTFFDVMFYLLAGWCLLADKLTWIIPLTLFAALNRETSALIPMLVLTTSVFAMEDRAWRRVWPLAATATAVYVAVFIGLRASYGPQDLLLPSGHHFGLDMLQYNLARSVTWSELLVTLGVVPLAALLNYRAWPQILRVTFWTIVPVWLLVHLFAAVLAEARLMLVPQALVFIPGALAGLNAVSMTDRTRSSRTETVTRLAFRSYRRR